MKCILHIGTEKTGTTTLQHFLYANKEALGKMGFGVLKSMGKGNNRRLASYGMHDYKLYDDYFVSKNITKKEEKIEHDSETESLLKSELSKLEQIGCHTVLISSEHFHSRCESEEEVFKVASILKRYFKEIKVLCYLRPQIDVAISLYTTVLRSGAKISFEEFINRNCRVDNSYYDYEALLKRWSAVFSVRSIFPRIFEPDKLAKRDLVYDFLEFSGVNNSNTLVFYEKENESLTPFGQEVLRLNNIYPYDFIYEGVPFNSFVYKKVNELLVGKGFSVGKSKALKIQRAFEKSNRNVAIKWFSSVDLFSIDYDKYHESSLNEGQKFFLKVLFSQKNNIVEGSFENSEKIFSNALANKLSNKLQAPDVLRETAFAFEQTGDIQTACKLMKQAHYLRPDGPVIKQKLEEYRQLLGREKKPSITPEGIETINAIGHRDYVGGMWKEIGQLQFNFLVAQGLKPEHTLLDIACGSLRGGVHFINYLNVGNYLGLDKEQELINRGVEQELGKDEQAEKQPEFVISNCFEFDKFSKKPDYAIAQSLFTHLVESDIKRCLKKLKEFVGHKPLTFFATFFECETPKQGELKTSHSHAKFEYTRAQMEQFGKETGWQVEYIGDWGHPRGQKMAKYFIKGQA